MMGTDRHAFVVVANRLPVDRIDGAWEASPGGLVSAVAPVVREQAGAWVGWANRHDDSLEPFDFDGMSLVPVSLSHDEHQQYYEGFCNATLWPLHHDLIVAPQYHRSWWRAFSWFPDRSPKPKPDDSGERPHQCPGLNFP